MRILTGYKTINMMTWLEIDSKAIAHNISQFRKKIGKDRLLMPVIKANAYGHGFLNLAKICQRNAEVNRVCVVNSDEALDLIRHHFTKPIMILSFYDTDSVTLKILGKKGVIFPVYCMEQAKILDSIGVKLNKQIKIHIKIDTGTSRVGFLPAELAGVAEKLKKMKFLNIEGVWSHFASSEDDLIYTQKQYLLFFKCVDLLKKKGIDPLVKHMSCSASISTVKLNGFNAFRFGVSLYGLHPSAKTRRSLVLQPALTWRTKIIQIKTLPPNTKIGYGGTYTTRCLTRLAVLAVGYWDGYDRKLSNKAIVLIHGKKCSIRGRISMNLCMVDVTGLKHVKRGDTATLIGKSGEKEVSSDDLAKWADTINYEIVDRINPLLPRILK
ncbi:alanine racemase [Patescibacteria group bacterium]|nr:alanine racemase [Patescibacteria group bacterium]MBU1613210.1 alanine racemase [Patescibacteria group bacterium]